MPNDLDNRSEYEFRPLIDAARQQVERAQPVQSRGRREVPIDHEGSPIDLPGYRILREIHRGGQGVVYLAVQKSTQRKVAVKVVREGVLATAPDRSRFQREVAILGQLNHPNVVTILDSGSVAGMFFFVTDFVAGQPLDVYLADKVSSIEQKLRVFCKVCLAVSAAHQLGVIHRDLKPANIRVDANGEPYLLDFGLAKGTTGELGEASEGPALTTTGQFIGSLPWASPEQIEGVKRALDIRTDVYSLGVILFQMLTGRLPYPVGGRIRSVLDNIATADPIRPGVLNRQLRGDLEIIILKALKKSPSERYQSAAAFADDIERFLENRPILARSSTFAYELRRLASRHAASIALCSAIVLAAIGAGVREIQHARAKARNASDLAELTLRFTDAMTDVNLRFLASDEGRMLLDEVEQILRAKRVTDYVGRAAWDRLAHCHDKLGNHEKSVEIYRRMLDLNLETLGPRHQRTLRSVQVLGDALITLGRCEEAETGIRAVFDSFECKPGDVDGYPPDQGVNVRLLRLAYTLGKVRHCLGRDDEAEALLRTTLNAQQSRQDPNHTDPLDTMHELASLLAGTGRLDAAERMAKELIELRGMISGSTALTTLEAMLLLGNVQRMKGRPLDAEQHLREATHQASLEMPGYWRTGIYQAAHARCLADLGRYEEAESKMLAAHKQLAGTLGASHQETQKVAAYLADLNEARAEQY